MEAPKLLKNRTALRDKAPNERTEQQESDGDGDDMEADILQHVHV